MHATYNVFTTYTSKCAQKQAVTAARQTPNKLNIPETEMLSNIQTWLTVTTFISFTIYAAFCPITEVCYLRLTTTRLKQALCTQKTKTTRMWAHAKRDGRPAEYRWRPLFNAAKFGWRPQLECHAVTLPRRETRWNLQGCPNSPTDLSH